MVLFCGIPCCPPSTILNAIIKPIRLPYKKIFLKIERFENKPESPTAQHHMVVFFQSHRCYSLLNDNLLGKLDDS
jgi:hypothetical protein